MPEPGLELLGWTKAQIEAIAEGVTNITGLSVKLSVVLATAEALPTNAYANGTEGVGATLTATLVGALEVDGSAAPLGKRVLVKNEAEAKKNGIYVVTKAGGLAEKYVLTRATDQNKASEFDGAFTFVESGTVNAGTAWAVAASGAVTVGTTAIEWTEIGLPGEVKGPASSTENDLAVFSGVSGKVIKDSGVVLSSVVSSSPKVIAASGSALTLNLSEGTVFRITLNENCTLTFPTPEEGKSFTLYLEQDGTGSRTVAWPAIARWGNGVYPTLSTAAGAVDVIYFQCFDGVHWGGFPGGYSMAVGGSSATVPAVVQTALNLKQSLSEKEEPNGYAGLDSLKRQPLSQVQPSVGGDYLPAAVETISRRVSVNTKAGTSKLIYFTYFTADKTLKFKKFKMGLGATPASGLTACKMGLYTATEAGALTCAARTAEQLALFEGAEGVREAVVHDNGAASPAEISEYEVVRGTRYAFAFFAIGTTLPTLSSTTAAGIKALFLTVPFITTVTSENQTDLPATLAANKQVGTTFSYYGLLE